MRILALETSGLYGSVAVLDDDRVIGETELPRDRRSAQMLAPAIQQQLAAVQWRPAEIELIAVTQGPGSFTGLRVGITTAKTLAYATGAAVLGVNTLAVIAAQVAGESRDVCAVLDAQRQQLYAATFRRTPAGRLETIAEATIVDRTAWLANCGGLAVTGSGLKGLVDLLPQSAVMVNEEFWAPRAATVGQLAFCDYQTGRRDDVWQLLPLYIRRSAAEEKWPA